MCRLTPMSHYDRSRTPSALRRQGRELVVIPGDWTVRRVLEITGASDRLRFVYSDRGLRELLAA